MDLAIIELLESTGINAIDKGMLIEQVQKLLGHV